MIKSHALLVLLVAMLGRHCPAQQSPIAVSVAQPIQTATADLDFTGLLEPAKTAEVRAAVDGTVRQIAVKDGDLVTEGQLLVQLDDRSLQSKIDAGDTEIGQLKAQLDQLKKKADADLEKLGDAKADEEQTAPIVASRDLVAANIQIKELELQQLRDDLAETKITAPLAGRVSQLSAREGGDVFSSPISATRICQITQTDPVRACFNVDQTTLNDLRKMQQSIQHDASQTKPFHFSMAAGDDQDFKYQGSLDYLGSRADSQTGQVRVCAIFPNPDGALDAAALAKDDEDRTVQIRFGLQLPRTVLLVIKLAVGRDGEGRNIVLAVNDKNQIVVRPVTLGPQHQELQVIDGGLNADEWIVIGTPAAKLNPSDVAFSPIDFNSDLRFGNLGRGATVVPVKTPMPRPGKSLRDQTREEVRQQKAAKK